MQELVYFFTVQIKETGRRELAFQSGCLNLAAEHDLKML